MNKTYQELTLAKGAEKYVFRFTATSRQHVLRVLGRFAANPELSFNWYDAAVLSTRLRRDARQSSSEPPGRPVNRCFRRF